MTSLKKKFVSYTEKSNHHWGHIKKHDYNFDYKFETGQKALKEIKKQEMIDFFMHFFVDHKRMIEFHVTPENSVEEQRKYRIERYNNGEGTDFEELIDHTYFRRT